jgi:ATP/maltotriose-dependent transcriptional regulator MalT
LLGADTRVKGPTSIPRLPSRVHANLRTLPVALRAAPRLSGREVEVLQLVTKGFTFVEISELLALSPHTVGTYAKRIYGKLRVCSKTEAVYEARNLGLVIA